MKTAKRMDALGPPANGQGPLLERIRAWENHPVMRRIRPKGMPLLFGNEDFEMGESTLHTLTVGILLYGLTFHFASLPRYRVFGNLNLYYNADEPTDYVSPDIMVVKPSRVLPVQMASYQIGKQGPAPFLVCEVLSFRTWQQGDLTRKTMLYSTLGVEEYLLTDVTGEMLDQRLLLLRRQRDGSWQDEQDPDGGVTSRLGFRLVLEADGQLRVIDAKTGKAYARPDEAQETAESLQQAQEQIRHLQAEVKRLRQAARKKPGRGNK